MNPNWDRYDNSPENWESFKAWRTICHPTSMEKYLYLSPMAFEHKIRSKIDRVTSAAELRELAKIVLRYHSPPKTLDEWARSTYQLISK